MKRLFSLSTVLWLTGCVYVGGSCEVLTSEGDEMYCFDDWQGSTMDCTAGEAGEGLTRSFSSQSCADLDYVVLCSDEGDDYTAIYGDSECICHEVNGVLDSHPECM